MRKRLRGTVFFVELFWEHGVFCVAIRFQAEDTIRCRITGFGKRTRKCFESLLEQLVNEATGKMNKGEPDHAASPLRPGHNKLT